MDALTSPLVSIAIPFYNAEKFLDCAICSVLNQTYTNWELILLDDGSSDNSLAIANKYRSDVRVRIISDSLNRGLVYRLNQSITLAKGKYYARMDADDVMHIRRIETQVRYMDNNTDIDVMGTAVYIMDFNGNIKGMSCVAEANRKLLFFHPSIMGKIGWFRNNKYDSRFERAEDAELWLRTRATSNFDNINEPLLFYRLNEDNVYGRYIKSFRSVIKIFRNGRLYHINAFICFKSIVLTYIKIVVYTLLHLIDCDHIIQRFSDKSLINVDTSAISDEYMQSVQLKSV